MKADKESNESEQEQDNESEYLSDEHIYGECEEDADPGQAQSNVVPIKAGIGLPTVNNRASWEQIDNSCALHIERTVKEKKPKKLTGNVIAVFEHHQDYKGLYGFNKLTRRVEMTRSPAWGTPKGCNETATLARSLERMLGFSPSFTMIEIAINSVANDNPFDPLEAYVQGLAHDGKPRLETWLSDYLGVEGSDYTRAVGRAFLISAIARALQPGCKVDTCLVLEGGQGVGKSTAVSILGGDFYTDLHFDPRNKDMLQNMVGRWIIELGELDGLNRSSVAETKRFLSVSNDVYRRSYGRDSEEYPRRCVFIGTCNESEYLSDSTGARRFLPVRVGRIDKEALLRDRDQLFAEAKEAFLQGEPWYLKDSKIIEEANEQAKDRRIEEPWKDIINEWLCGKGGRVAIARHKGLGVSIEQVMSQALGIEIAKQIGSAPKKVAKILRELGYEKKRQRLGQGEQRSLWCKT